MEERKPIIKNVFGRKKKIAVIGINGNHTAKDVVQALKDKGFQRVYEFDSLRSFPAYYALGEFEPDYTLIVDEGAQCKIKSCIVDDRTELHTKEREESEIARDFYRFPFKMIGITPSLSGKERIPYEDVKDMPWFLTDNSPMLCLKLPAVHGVPEAVAKAVEEYFTSHGKIMPKEEKPSCNCLYGSTSR